MKSRFKPLQEAAAHKLICVTAEGCWGRLPAHLLLPDDAFGHECAERLLMGMQEAER